MKRNRTWERDALVHVGRGFSYDVRRRLDEQQPGMGDGWADRHVFELCDEAEQEPLDAAAWLLLAHQRARLDGRDGAPEALRAALAALDDADRLVEAFGLALAGETGR